MNRIRRVAAVTVARSDFGILQPVLQALDDSSEFELGLMVSGMHLDPRFDTIGSVEESGLPILARLPMLEPVDSRESIAKSIANGVAGFAEALVEHAPDFLLLLGDRFEMFAAAIAALPLQVPLAHVHGGEVTEGAIDDAIRHSITKMSHLHFTATEVYAQRVRQLGEEAWRVTVSGAPALDHLNTLEWLDAAQLSRKLEIDFTSGRVLLVTFHPVTVGADRQVQESRAFFSALSDWKDYPILVTHPNADPGSGGIMREINEFVEQHANARLFGNLGTQVYFSCMRHASAMVGNSSSGLVEAGSFALPVVNVGERQRGRIRGKNVIDVECDPASITEAIATAVSPAFRQSIKGMVNPYGRCNASATIVETLARHRDRGRLLDKRFIDVD